MKDQLNRADFWRAIHRAEAEGMHSLALALTLLYRRIWPNEDCP